MKYSDFREKVQLQAETTRTYDLQGNGLYTIRGMGKLDRTSVRVIGGSFEEGMVEPYVAVLSSRERDESAQYRKHRVLLGSSATRGLISFDEESGLEYFIHDAHLDQESSRLPNATESDPTWFNLRVEGIRAITLETGVTSDLQYHPLHIGYSDNAAGMLIANGHPVIADALLEAMPENLLNRDR